MKKNIKFLFLAFLFVCIACVPVFGVSFYDSPSVFDDNAILTNIKFGGGTSVYLALDSQDEKVVTEENLNKTATILKKRFQDRGYNDATTSLVDKTIRLNFAQKDYIDSLITSVASLGEWSFVGSDPSKPLCTASMVKDAYVSANADGGYSITLEFTKEGKGEFFANTASYAASGASFYLMMDGQYAAMANITDSTVRDTFTFGSYEYTGAATLASMIKNGQLPSAVKIVKTEALAPELGTGVQVLIYGAVALILVALLAFFFLKGKIAGIFPAASLLSLIAVFLTAMANASYQLNFVTLITMTLCLIFAGFLNLFATTPVGNSLKKNNAVSGSAMKNLNKVTLKAVWAHAILLAISLVFMFFAHGMVLYAARIVLLFTCANAILYSIFVYFGIRTLAE